MFANPRSVFNNYGWWGGRPKDWKYAREHAVFKKMTRRQARIASEDLQRKIHREYFGSDMGCT